MNLTYNTTTIFPTIIHQFDIGGFEHIKGQLIDYSYNLKKKDPVGTKLSNHGGWQSTSFPVTTKEDVLQSLLINCLSKFPSVSESVNITISAWVNINKTGDYNVSSQYSQTLKNEKKVIEILSDDISDQILTQLTEILNDL